MPDYPSAAEWVVESLREGMVIPAHPLALNRMRRFDEVRQCALTRYYHAAGAGGLAVAVHTTQFAIRSPAYNLYDPVLELAWETADQLDSATGRRTVMIAGVCGDTNQAITEAITARNAGYHAALLSLGALPDATVTELLDHCHRVACEIPLVGFYLQPAVGGRLLPAGFWREFAAIPNVIAIKIAPFNRYQTLDVVRGVAESGRGAEIALYTGNDDNIVADLVTSWHIPTVGGPVDLHMAGGLLGHWACWTKRAVELFEECRSARRNGSIPADLLARGQDVVHSNAALFDSAHGFAGSIAGINYVLHRQGLLSSSLCLDPNEALSPGQSELIDRVYGDHPELTDDDFVRAHLDEWVR